MDIRPVTLLNRHVRLEPLAPVHGAGLFAIGQQAEDWRYMPRPCFTSLDDTLQWIDEALDLQRKGLQCCFVIIDPASDTVAGSSRYLNLRPKDRGLEIGYSWLGPAFQRSAINTAAKLLLLSHAFDTLGMMRVEFKTDARNLRSQTAITRLGASREGLFRSHMLVQNDYVRDSVYFSIIDGEWPVIKTRMQQSLEPM